ncbi:hypothetical protein D3C76_01450 [compost metagenome]
MHEPTCYDCRYGDIKTAGDGWYEEKIDKFVCKNEESNDEVFNFMNEYSDINVIIERGPVECPMFTPWMVYNCSWVGCKKQMNIPLYKAEFFISDNPIRTHFFCSDSCKVAYTVLKEIEDK